MFFFVFGGKWILWLKNDYCVCFEDEVVRIFMIFIYVGWMDYDFFEFLDKNFVFLKI